MKEETMEHFMERKSREPGGGRFYAVISKGRKIRTEWGRNEGELFNFLKEQGEKFDSLEVLV